uniref:Uncharacterized protein n=1 Tax=Anguilla anguilla TaxID=7936 RepID=A0A0E9TY72_ANGAN
MDRTSLVPPSVLQQDELLPRPST